MNYHQARQRKSDGRWNWTTMNDGSIWTSGPCTQHDDGHETAEDAERHFYEHEAANLRESEFRGAQYPCAICKGWSTKQLEARLMGSAVLCDEHRSPEGWKQAVPFTPGIQITASW